MRILVHDYAGHAFPIELSRELAARGHTVLHAFAANLLTPRGALSRQPSDPPGLDFMEVPMNANYRRDKYSFVRRRRYEVAYGSELVSLAALWKPEVVLSGQTPSEPQHKFHSYCRRHGIRFVNWIQDIYSVAVSKLARSKLPVIGHAVGAYYDHLDRRCARKAEHNIVITDDFKLVLESWRVAPTRITTIPNWAAIDALPQLERKNPWSAKQRLDDRFTFLYSGTLAMKHNPNLLLELAKSFSDDASVQVVVVSEGPGADWLLRAKNEHKLSNLRILPFQPFRDFPRVLASADVLLAVLEADAGTFSVPSKVLSYLCAGRPLLTAMPATNLAARIVTSIPAGIAVAPDEPDRFVSSARQLWANSHERAEFAASARKYAEENFRIAEVAAKFEALLVRN